MKPTVRCLLPAIALLATVSCATYNAKAMQSIGDVAVVSIQCVRLVDTGDQTDWAGTAKFWARADQFDLSPAAERIRSDVFGAYERSLPSTFLDEKSLLGSWAYRSLASGKVVLLPAKEVTLPTDYLAVPVDNRTSVRTLIERLPEADAFLWAEASYSLVKKSEFMETAFASMRADLTVTILDRRGRGILRHTEMAEDDKEFRIVGIQMVRADEVASAAARATARASAAMARWLEGKAAR